MATLTGAVAAGPSAAKEIVKKTPHSLVSALDGVGMNTHASDGVAMPDEFHESRETLLKRLARWGNPDWRQRQYQRMDVYKIAPDLDALRSMSLSAKMNIQRRRNFRDFERRNKGWIERKLLGEDD